MVRIPLVRAQVRIVIAHKVTRSLSYPACVHVDVRRSVCVMQKHTPDLAVQWDRVQVMRQMRDLTDDGALVAAMGISGASWSRVMSGKQRPGTRFIAALCIALNVNPSDICVIDETGAMRRSPIAA